MIEKLPPVLTLNDVTPENLPAGLKELRASMGDISQEILAHRLGMTVRTVARWEKGDSIPAESLARLLEVAIGIEEPRLIFLFLSAILVRLHLDGSLKDFMPHNASELVLVWSGLRYARGGTFPASSLSL